MISSRSELRTIWYMGAKTRILPGFIEGAIRDLMPDNGTFLDLCSGTAVVARSVADRYRVHANDVLSFCSTIARAHLSGDAEWGQVLDRLDPKADLDRAADRNLGQLSRLVAEALTLEDRLLPGVIDELGCGQPGEAVSAYRRFLDAAPTPRNPGRGKGTVYSSLSQVFDGFVRERRRDPSLQPYGLVTFYYHNTYFGLRQALVIDSYRAAIDRIPASDPFQRRKQDLYLAALLQAASVSTSGTSHFAQPRSLRKDSELLAVAKRRRIDIDTEFHTALHAIRREWGERPRRRGNKVFSLPADELLAPSGPLAGESVDLVYFDPPYTSDHHSRFYHVLETLTDYGYPELERRGGEVTRGLYPVREKRYRSDFCRAHRVEGAFRRVVEGCHALGANLLVSYSTDSLLWKRWQALGEEDPGLGFLRLFRDTYPHVEIRERELMHSGQGDSNRATRELLVLCER